MRAEVARERVLVTGAHSFSAGPLLATLVRREPTVEVFTTGRRPHGPQGFDYAAAELTDRAAVNRLIESVSPQLIYHLAGARSADDDLCWAVNLEATRNLLEAAAALAPTPRVVLISSAAVYGPTPDGESPVKEDTPLQPIGAYGASKAAAEAFALSLQRRCGLPVVVVRPFNLLGPGLWQGAAAADFVEQVRAVRDGRSTEIRVGNLDPRRDFVDVRDAARAYAALGCADAVWGNTYNLASGRSVAVRDLLHTVLRVSGVTAPIVTDPDRCRPVEVHEQTGDSTALRRDTGWTPTTTLEQSLRDMLDAA